MTITLTPEQENIINQKVADGDFSNVNEVIDVALRLLLERQSDEEPMSLEEIRHELVRADAQIERGEYRILDKQELPALFEEIKAKASQRRTERQNESLHEQIRDSRISSGRPHRHLGLHRG